jgi:hypothetical protein
MKEEDARDIFDDFRKSKRVNGRDAEQMPLPLVDSKKPTPQISKGLPMIDGRRLTISEKAFQEWSASRFDTRAWMKKIGVRWG